MITLIIILLLPFLQLGLTYYLSVSTLLVLLFSLSLRIKDLIYSEKCLVKFLFLVIFAIFMLIAGGEVNGYFNSDHLRNLREASFLVIILMVLSSKLYWNERLTKKVVNILLISSVLIFSLTLIQSFFILKFQYIGIPEHFYVMNAGTIPNELDLIYSKIRPAATFGEPSYLSLYCLLTIIGVFPLIKFGKKYLLIVLFSSLTIVTSLSMMGIIFLLIFILINYIKSNFDLNKKILIMLPFFTIFIYLVFSFLIERLFNVVSGSDISFNDRVLTPIKYVPDILMNYPFGIKISDNFYDSYKYGYVDISYIMHNAIITFLYSYGFLGFIIVYLIFSSANSNYIKYALFIMMMQNGGLLNIDKVVLVFFLVYLFNSSNILSNKLRNM
ncbi:hypothetical protein MOW08_00430 [Acinetobacter schindleri]|nr:hypothetical protein MOW08_00430 [Acinetobacter schindleri]